MVSGLGAAAATSSAKRGLTRVAGDALARFFQNIGPQAEAAVRGVGKEVVEQGATQAAKNVLGGKVGGLTAAQLANTPLIPAVGRSLTGSAANIEKAASLAGKIAPVVATGATALYGQNVIDNIFDQQGLGSQPFRGRKSGNSDFDSFIHAQALEQQRLENEMAVVRQKAVLSVPTPVEMAQAEKIATEAGEATNKEVLQVARSIYGTGLRA
tara:strand:- start:317 stop:952 length:636 start_codon:yes stop_codon:yes gene_type:complete